MAGNPFNYPHVISSETPEGLQAAMLKNNTDNNTEYVYFSIVHDTRRFHAFYMKLDEQFVLLKKKKTSKE